MVGIIGETPTNPVTNALMERSLNAWALSKRSCVSVVRFSALEMHPEASNDDANNITGMLVSSSESKSASKKD